MMGSTGKADPPKAVRLKIIDSPGQPMAGCDEPRSAASQAREAMAAVLWELINVEEKLRTTEKERKGETYDD